MSATPPPPTLLTLFRLALPCLALPRPTPLRPFHRDPLLFPINYWKKHSFQGRSFINIIETNWRSCKTRCTSLRTREHRGFGGISPHPPSLSPSFPLTLAIETSACLVDLGSTDLATFNYSDQWGPEKGLWKLHKTG